MQNEQCLVNGSKGVVQHKQKERKLFDIFLKNGNIRRLKEEERRKCGLNLGISNVFKELQVKLKWSP